MFFPIINSIREVTKLGALPCAMSIRTPPERPQMVTALLVLLCLAVPVLEHLDRERGYRV
jgi:hypothetical protein